MPRRKNIPIKVINLGSSKANKLDFSRKELYKRMSPQMGKKAIEIPVYLVNPQQMDLIYPKERRRCLNPEGLKQWAKRWNEKIEEIERLLEYDEVELKEEQLDRLADMSDIKEVGYTDCGSSIAIGLYLNNSLSENSNEKLDFDKPSIFICPERVIDWAKRNNLGVNLVLDKVYYHELAHAMIDNNRFPYNEPWVRIIEESLANWIAFKCFSGTGEAIFIQKLIQQQPLEYQGYTHIADAFIRFARTFWWLNRWRRWYWWELIEMIEEMIERIKRIIRKCNVDEFFSYTIYLRWSYRNRLIDYPRHKNYIDWKIYSKFLISSVC